MARCLYKHHTGCAIRYEETHFNLGLRCSATLVPTDEFGLVRDCRIENLNDTPVGIRLLDGWHGLLPPGVAEETYARFSYLAAAAMRHELHEPERLGLDTLNCGITDRAEPFEALRVAVAWSTGHPAPRLFLSDRAIPACRRGEALAPQREIRGEMGAYLAETQLELTAGASRRWFTVADTGLDHAAPDRAAIHRLQLMLEGQVAALASGSFSASAALKLLDALRHSELYRPDQHRYMLQPDRVIPPFEDRNRLPADWEQRVPLLADAVRHGDAPVIVTDARGNAHFGADLTNERSLRDAIRRLLEKSALPEATAAETTAMLALWEEGFHHQSFIGRSGGMFAFEGLGSIDWHMVAKLLLAVREVHVRETRENPGATAAARRLADAYDDIRAGLGFTKTPLVYGAFPADPYSHSPRHLGAQQPGMTGQVKEAILTRFGELGVAVDDGCLTFGPQLLHPAEFFPTGTSFRYYNAAGEACRWDLPSDSLGFTLFDIPIAYQLAPRPAARGPRSGSTGRTAPLHVASMRVGMVLDGPPRS